MQSLFETISSVTESNASFAWADDTFLLENEVSPYVQMPLWVPSENYSGFNRYNIDKAITAGLTFRPLTTTIQDTLTYSNSRPSDYEWRGGLTPTREKELLTKLTNIGTK